MRGTPSPSVDTRFRGYDGGCVEGSHELFSCCHSERSEESKIHNRKTGQPVPEQLSRQCKPPLPFAGESLPSTRYGGCGEGEYLPLSAPAGGPTQRGGSLQFTTSTSNGYSAALRLDRQERMYHNRYVRSLGNCSPAVILRNAATKNLRSLPRRGRDAERGSSHATHEG